MRNASNYAAALVLAAALTVGIWIACALPMLAGLTR